MVEIEGFEFTGDDLYARITEGGIYSLKKITFGEDGYKKISKKEISFKKISPENFMAEIEKEKNTLKSLLEEKWNSIVKPNLGKIIEDRRQREEIKTEIKRHFPVRSLFDVLSELDQESSIEDGEEFIKKAKEWKPAENRIYMGQPFLDIEEDEQMIAFLIQAIQPEMPDEVEILERAVNIAIYKNIGEAFKPNFEIAMAYAKGMVDFDFFVKMIDPRKRPV